MSEVLNNGKLPGVVLVIGSGALGVESTSDGIAGMIVESYAVAGLAMGVAKAVFSANDAAVLGFTAAQDAATDLWAWRHIAHFYDTASEGAELWVMPVPEGTSLADMVAADGDYAPKLLEAAGGKVRLLAVAASSEPEAPDYSQGLEAEVYEAMTAAQAMAVASAERMAPVRIILPGNRMSADIGALRDLRQEACPRVQIFVGSSRADGYADVGLLLGRYAAEPVQRNPGRVLSGSLPITAAYLTTGQAVSAYLTALGELHERGYVALRNYTGRSGFFVTDDPTCTATTDDYRSFARGRVMDKAVLIAYAVYTDYVLDEIAVNDAGEMDAGRLKALQSRMEGAINQAMTAQGEISSVSVAIDAKQDVLTTGRVEATMELVPVGYLKKISVTMGFLNPYNA